MLLLISACGLDRLTASAKLRYIQVKCNVLMKRFMFV